MIGWKNLKGLAFGNSSFYSGERGMKKMPLASFEENEGQNVLFLENRLQLNFNKIGNIGVTDQKGTIRQCT